MQVNRLKGKMVEAGYTQRTLAQEMQMSKNTLNNKINGRSPLYTSEVVRLCSLLGIKDNTEKAEIFLQ